MKFSEIRIIATSPCIANQLRDVSIICRRSWYIATHIRTIYDFKMKSSRLSYILVLSWPLSSNSRYESKNDADKAVSVVSLISSSGGYTKGRISSNRGLLIDKTCFYQILIKLRLTVHYWHTINVVSACNIFEGSNFFVTR
jgi:hypothetical protein